MEVKILCFGITRDVIGSFEHTLTLPQNAKVADLKEVLFQKYPQLTGLKSLRIAVNETYGNDAQELNSTDEIVLIPPVSGG